MKIQYTGTQLLANLSAMIAADAAFEEPKCILIIAPDGVPPTAALEDVEVPSFTGYATSAAVTWGTPHLDNDGNAVVFTHSVEFKATADVDPATATHMGLVSNDGATLLAVCELNTPFTFATAQDVLTVAFPLMVSQPTESDEDVNP